MRAYTKRVRDNILPLSIGDTLPKAFEEWSFTGNTHDHEEPDQTCELCGKEGLRYHFKIQNFFTNHALNVGSECILQFELSVYEDGRQLNATDSRKKLNSLREKMRLDSCLKALDRLAQTENNEILRSALEYYRKNKKLTPKFAFVVFWRMAVNKIDHDPGFFNITLRTDRFKKDLKLMETSRVHYFWKALTEVAPENWTGR